MLSLVEQFSPETAGSGGFCGSSISGVNFRIFSDDFRPVPEGKHRKLAGIN